MAILVPNPSMQNLKITLCESILLQPSEETEKRSFFLSCLDQVLLYPVPFVSFFKAHPAYPPETVARKLKTALAKLLVHYDFMAGRFKVNLESSRLEIDCNAMGAGFVVGSSEFSLGELGDLERPNTGFYQLVPETVDALGPDDDQPLFLFQVTSFTCGGFAIGMSISHCLLDGVGICVFMENLASQTFDNRPLSTIPCHDRHLLDARSPPKITELLNSDVSSLPSIPAFEELDHRVFQFTPSILNHLKEFAKGPNMKENPSSFMVVAALMWRCKALSSCGDDHTVSTLFTTVEFRSKLNPPLPPSYSGNAILVSPSSAKRGDIECMDFSELVEMVVRGTARMSDDECIRSFIDWFEVNKVPPHGDYVVSWLVRMRSELDQVVYPWGKPVNHGTVVSPSTYIVCFVYPGEDGAVNACVSLPSDEMVQFEIHFRNFLALSYESLQKHSRL